jgi:carbonic anhydrase
MRKFIVTVFLALLSVSAFAQTPDQLWGELIAGNKVFVKGGQVVYDSMRERREGMANGQLPPVSILSCSDSRVPPEIVFQKTLGELFVVRVAGNVEDTYGVASLEYAASKGWTKLLVVMGHSDCGAVTSSLAEPKQDQPTPSLYELILRIRKSFMKFDQDLPARTADNVCYTAMQLRRWSPTLKAVAIKTALYDVRTGVVTELSCGTTRDPTPLCRSSKCPEPKN